MNKKRKKDRERIENKERKKGRNDARICTIKASL